jgi:hypothetical protein
MTAMCALPAEGDVEVNRKRKEPKAIWKSIIGKLDSKCFGVLIINETMCQKRAWSRITLYSVRLLTG